jgi:uncharacterized protein (DUF1778 family)
MATTEAQKRATIKYMEKNLEEVRFRVPKGQKDVIRKYAQSHGKSLSAYIKDLIMQDMEKNA